MGNRDDSINTHGLGFVNLWIWDAQFLHDAVGFLGCIPYCDTDYFQSSVLVFVVDCNDLWNLFEAKLRALPISNPQARKLSRFFLVGASDVTVDKQGRITLPMQLREFAGITRDVLLAGVGNHLEIWNPDRYNELNTYEDMDEVAMSLEGFNI